jgi:hypothetical protein
MASSHLFLLEGSASSHHSRNHDTNDWRGQSLDPPPSHTPYVFPPHQAGSNSSITLKEEFSQLRSYPDDHQNMHNHIRRRQISSHRNADWPPLSHSSSPQPSHPDRSRIRSSSISYLPPIPSTEMPPPSISAMRRTSFSGRNQDRDLDLHEAYYKHSMMSNPHSLVKPKDADLNYSDSVAGHSVYYRPPSDTVFQSQLESQTPWDKNSYRYI